MIKMETQMRPKAQTPKDHNTLIKKVSLARLKTEDLNTI